MSELEDRVDELKYENQELREENQELRELISDLETFAKTCAISVEQLWDKVYPGVTGQDLRDLV